jgi:hypothetical protein
MTVDFSIFQDAKLVLSSVRDVRQWEKRRDGLSVGR